jgi:hypothetical protein
MYYTMLILRNQISMQQCNFHKDDLHLTVINGDSTVMCSFLELHNFITIYSYILSTSYSQHFYNKVIFF